MGVIDEFSSMQDTGFGCAVTNRFDRLLDDEGDPFDILREAQSEKQKKKKKEEQKKPTQGKPGKKESQKDRKVPISAGGEGGQKVLLQVGQISSEGRGEKRVAFRERRYNEIEASLEYSIEKYVLEDSGHRNRPTEAPEEGAEHGARGKGWRQPRNTDVADLRHKREFDRHSGSVKSGVRPEEKRGGNGSHNWGSMKDQMSAVADGTPVEDGADIEGVQEVAEVDGEPRATEADGEGLEEAAIEMSLDEWKALQEQSRPKIELNLRKAETSVPSKARVIHRSKHLEDVGNELTEEDEEGHYFRRPANDITSRMDINFGCLERQMRGGRGGRGWRGRGSATLRPETEPPSRSEVTLLQAPNPDDPVDFPALTAGEA